MSVIEQLAASHCSPRSGAKDRLDAERRDEVLPELGKWTLGDAGEVITRRFSFKDYHRTIAFVNALAFVAHREDHHPDLEVGYNRCVVHFSTHDVGGLSENDLICAAQAECLYRDADR